MSNSDGLGSCLKNGVCVFVCLSVCQEERQQWEQGYEAGGCWVAIIQVRGVSLVVQWLRLCAPDAAGWGLIPDQGIRSHMPQPRVCKLQLRPSAVKWIDLKNNPGKKKWWWAKPQGSPGDREQWQMPNIFGGKIEVCYETHRHPGLWS